MHLPLLGNRKVDYIRQKNPNMHPTVRMRTASTLLKQQL